MLNCRHGNNGVKDVAYKCYASSTQRGGKVGRRGEAGWGVGWKKIPAPQMNFYTWLIRELTFCAQQLATIYGGN